MTAPQGGPQRPDSPCPPPAISLHGTPPHHPLCVLRDGQTELLTNTAAAPETPERRACLQRAFGFRAFSENPPTPSCYTMTKKSNHKWPRSQVMPDAQLSNPMDAGTEAAPLGALQRRTRKHLEKTDRDTKTQTPPAPRRRRLRSAGSEAFLTSEEDYREEEGRAGGSGCDGRRQAAGKGLRGAAESWWGLVSNSRDTGLRGLEYPANWQSKRAHRKGAQKERCSLRKGKGKGHCSPHGSEPAGGHVSGGTH